MSLETVVEDIRETARERAEELLAEAEAEADTIVEEAEAEAEDVLEAAEREAERQIDRERDQQLSSATLEAKQARLEARRDELESVREAVERAVADLEGETREELTRTLFEAATVEFDDPDGVEVRGAEDDAELIEAIVAEHDGFAYGGTVDCLGGVVLESESSRLRVNNTFDSILASVWDEELRAISDRLFEEP